MSRFDDDGLFWVTPKRETARSKSDAPRALPPIPDSDWTLPEGYEAYPDLRGQGAIAIDVETKDLLLKEKGPGFVRGDAYVCGVAVGTEAGYRQYYPVRHELGPNLPPEIVFGWLNEQLSDPLQPKVGARLIYDLEALHYEGVKVAGPLYDVQVAEPLLDETRLSYALEVIARHHLQEGKRVTEMEKWLKTAFGDVANIKKFIYRAPSQVVGPYAESDVDLPLRALKVQTKLLEEQNLMGLFRMESKLIPMLLAMRIRGVPVNVGGADELMHMLAKGYEDTLDEIKRLSGHRPDVWAADSLAKVFDSVGVKYPMTTKTKKPSFRKEWLAAQTHPIANLIKDARHKDKFRGTFVQGYILDGNVNGRLYGQFHQLRSDEGGTVSGRFSSSLPNLQNIPIRTPEGKKIRQMFEAELNQKWWKFDWSQVEYRLIAHYAAITNQPGADLVVERYRNDPNVDYHVMVAEMTGLPRQDAKNLNFGLAYGQGVPLLCANLGVSIEQGKRIMDVYHEKAPYVRPLADLASRRADTNGQITTLLGRHRRFNVWERGSNKNHSRMSTEIDTNEYVSETQWAKFAYEMVEDTQLLRMGWTEDEVMDPEHNIRVPGNEKYIRAIKRSGWRRSRLHKALNALIQGSAADVMKKAMVDAWEAGLFSEIGAPHLTVHDELDGSFDPGIKSHVEALEGVKHIMETCVDLRVPLRADGGIGDNWGALE